MLRLDRGDGDRVDDVGHECATLRSLIGLFRPWSTGPIATAPPALRCTALYVLLPVLRSGKMRTVARPATGGESGILVSATDGSTAASYWMGPPSTSSSGARCRTSSVAVLTFSTSAPVPDVPVE